MPIADSRTYSSIFLNLRTMNLWADHAYNGDPLIYYYYYYYNYNAVPRKNVILFYFHMLTILVACGHQFDPFPQSTVVISLGTFLSYTNRKAGSPTFHTATAKQLKLQENVVCGGVLWSGSWTGFFSEPLMEADEQEVAQILRLRDVGSADNARYARLT